MIDKPSSEAGGPGEVSSLEARLSAVLEAVSDGFYAVDRDWRYVIFNRAAEDYFGVSRDMLLGKVIWEVFPQGVGTPFEQACRRARDEGVTSAFETRSRLRPDRIVELSVCPMPDGGVAVVLNDITERRRAEVARELLAREVDHRARNMLSVVQSIVQLTPAPSLAAYKEMVLGRVTALARAQSMLANSRWEGASLAGIVRDGLAAVGRPEACVVDGPEIALTPDQVQPVAMIVHELATNARKHGAFSVEAGRVAVSWSARAGKVRLLWCETSGPEVHPPTRRGFGSRLIHDLARQLGGEAHFHWRPEGLEVELTLAPPPPEA